MATVQQLEKEYRRFGIEAGMTDGVLATWDEDEEDRIEHLRLYALLYQINFYCTIAYIYLVSKREGKAHRRKSGQWKVRTAIPSASIQY